MFYVIGENYRNDRAYGEGETVEDALTDWATAGNIAGAIEEFNEYAPKIICGEQIVIKLEYTVSIVEK